MWSATSGTKLGTFTRHTEAVNTVRWSSDGTRIVSASQDSTAKIWLSADPSAVQEEINQPLTQFSISPNPAHGSFTASFEQASLLPTELRISNLLGQTVVTSTIPSGVSEWRVMTEGLPAGMYVVRCGAWVRSLVIY